MNVMSCCWIDTKVCQLTNTDHLYPSEINMQVLAPGNYRVSVIPKTLPFATM